MTVVKLAGYGDDYFLLLMLKGAGGLADPLPYHFPQAIQSAMAAYGNQSEPVCLSCSSCSALSCCLLNLRLSFLACLRCSICLVLSCGLLDLRLSFPTCLHFPSCSALSCCRLNLRLAFLVCLLACSPFSCLLALSLVFLRERLQFCSASTGSMINFYAAPRSDAGLLLSW